MEPVYQAFMEACLPNGILQWFEIKKVSDSGTTIRIFLEEKPLYPQSDEHYESKGFAPPKEIQDFPIQGKPCLLVIKRRKWKKDGQDGIYMRTLNLVAKGTKLTMGFSLFFNGRN